MKTSKYMCKLKSRNRIEAQIPRERWGWWADVCPGKSIWLRKATPADLLRCTLAEDDTRTAISFMCELGEHGSLVSKEAIEYVEMPTLSIEVAARTEQLETVLKKILAAHKQSTVDWDAILEAERLIGGE